MYCTFWIAKCLCKVSTSDIHSSFFRWHLKHDLTHGSKDQKWSHEEGEKEDICVSQRMEFANNFDRPKKGIIPCSDKYTPPSPLFSSLNEHHHLSLQKQRNGEKQGGLFYLEMMTAEQLNWLCLFPSPPPLEKNPIHTTLEICQKVVSYP